MELAESYRLSKISEIQQYLQDELCIREGLCRKYKKVLNSLQIFNGVCLSFGVGTSAGGLGVLMNDVGVSIAVGLQGVGVVVGVLGGIGKLVERWAHLRMQKHDEIKVLTEIKLTTIADMISEAYEDGHISDHEFKAINAIQRQYLSIKKEIQTRVMEGEKK